MSRYIFTNTADRTATSSLFMRTMREGTGPLELKKVVFPTSFYRINSGNNTLTVLEGAVTLTVTIPPGNYNSTDFESDVAALLDAASLASGAAETYTLAIDDSTGLLTISNVGTNFAPQFAGNTELAVIMGFTPTSPAVSASSVTGSYPVQLDHTHLFLAIAEADTAVLNFESRRHNLITGIPVPSGNAFQSIEYEPERSIPISTNADSITIYFLDEFYNRVNFNNATWLVELGPV